MRHKLFSLAQEKGDGTLAKKEQQQDCGDGYDEVHLIGSRIRCPVAGERKEEKRKLGGRRYSE